MAEEKAVREIQEIIPALVKFAEKWDTKRHIDDKVVQHLVLDHLSSIGDKFYVEDASITLHGFTRLVMDSGPRLTRLAVDYLKAVARGNAEEQRVDHEAVAELFVKAVASDSAEFITLKQAMFQFVSLYGKISLEATVTAVKDGEEVIITDVEVS